MPASTANGYQSLSKETKDLIIQDFLNGMKYNDLLDIIIMIQFPNKLYMFFICG